MADMDTYTIVLPSSAETSQRDLEGDNLPALLQRAQALGVSPTAVIRRRERMPSHPLVRDESRGAIFRQLADSLTVGLPLSETMRLIAHETHDRLAKQTVRRLLEGIQSGESFSAAARQSPELFTETDLAVIEAGERAGALDKVFSQLAETAETIHATTNRVGNAFIYPGVISIFALGIILFMLSFTVPRFTAIYADFHITFSPLLRWLNALSRIAVPGVLLICCGGLIFVMLANATRRFFAGRLAFDLWQLQLPLLHHLFYRLALMRGCAMMSLLTRHAVPLTEALRHAGRSCGNRLLRRGFEAASITVANGETLARSLEESEVFPRALVWRVALAESSGNLSDTFWQLTLSYAEQAETVTRLLASIIEPALIVVLGGAIALLVFAMFLPLFSILQSLCM